MKRNKRAAGATKFRNEPKVTFRIMRRCDFKCPACSTFSGPDKKGTMRVADFKKAVDILAAENFRGVVNISGGEPSLHPKLMEIVRYASGRLPAASIIVFTNGCWVGRSHWRGRLRQLLGLPNVTIRFSLDREHAEGALRATREPADNTRMRKVESALFKKASLFLEACQAEHALPGVDFDFAFKGSRRAAKKYLGGLGEVPLYLIRFWKDPTLWPKAMGFFAVEVDQNNDVLVYPTVGHAATGRPLGGLDTLPAALEMNRNALKRKKYHPRRRGTKKSRPQWHRSSRTATAESLTRKSDP